MTISLWLRYMYENHQTWIDREVKKLMASQNCHLTKVRKSSSADDWMTYRTLRNAVTSMIRKKKRDYVCMLSFHLK